MKNQTSATKRQFVVLFSYQSSALDRKSEPMVTKVEAESLANDLQVQGFFVKIVSVGIRT